MKKVSFFIHFFAVSLITTSMWYGYHWLTMKKPSQPFSLEKVVPRTIKYTITTAGILEIKDTFKIGSQLDGVIKSLHVKENDLVKKGQLLATIQTSKEDKDVLAARHVLEKAEQEVAYQHAFFQRQKALYDAGQLAQNTFEKVQSDYKKACAERDMYGIQLEKAQLEFSYKSITSPADGLITVMNVSEGAPVINDFQNILFEVAHDITKMKAIIDIDESEIGDIQPGLPVKLTINAFPAEPIISTLHDVSYAPKNGSGKTSSPDSVTTYKATILITNRDRKLRPGMRLTGTIQVKKINKAPSISGMPFQIDAQAMLAIAQHTNIPCILLSKEERAAYKAQHPGKNRQTVFVYHNNTFTQKYVEVGISDAHHWEITQGLQAGDTVVNNITSANELDELYKKIFKGNL